MRQTKEATTLENRKSVKKVKKAVKPEIKKKECSHVFEATPEKGQWIVESSSMNYRGNPKKIKVTVTVFKCVHCGELKEYPDFWKMDFTMPKWQTIIKQKASKKTKVKRVRRKWSMDLIINMIREMYKNGEPLNSKWVRENHHGLMSASIRYFGSWEGAVTTAGIRYDKVKQKRNYKWDKEKVIKSIQERHSQGKSLAHKRTLQNNPSLVHAAVRCCGSWEKAVESAGFAYRNVSDKWIWRPDDVLKGIRELKSQGRNLISTKIGREEQQLYRAGKKWYGTWENAVEAAGIKYEAYRKTQKWDKEKVIETIRKRIEIGKPVTLEAVRKEGNALPEAAYHHLGSWKKAVESAYQ